VGVGGLGCIEQSAVRGLTGITVTTPPLPTASTLGGPADSRKESGSQRYSTCVCSRYARACARRAHYAADEPKFSKAARARARACDIRTSPGYWLKAAMQAPLLMEPVVMASTVGSGFPSPAPEYWTSAAAAAAAAPHTQVAPASLQKVVTSVAVVNI
jgi:hypothetical protein